VRMRLRTRAAATAISSKIPSHIFSMKLCTYLLPVD
jgi:hypothetical protein